MGKNCIQESLKFFPEEIKTIYLAQENHELLPLINSLNITVKIISKHELTKIVASESHQNIAALVKDKQFVTLNDYLKENTKKEKDLLLFLDSIYDPQNLGTLFRAAECFGIGAVVWSKNRGADLTPVVSKASVGATELMTFIRVANLAEAARKVKENDYEIVTAEVGKNAQSLNVFNFPKKTALIMGSEGEGVRNLLSSLADHKVFIPMYGKIDSLNVSQATSVFLYEWQKQ